LEKERMRFPKINSISTRLFLVILAAVGPLLGLSIYHALQEQKDGILEQQAAALHQTMMTADNQQQLVNGVSVMLNAAAAGYRTLTTEPDKCTSFLADLISQEPQYDAVFLLHPDSTLLCSDRPTLAWLPDPEVVGRALLTDEIMLVPDQGNGQAKVAFLTRMLGLDGEVAGVSVVLLKTYGFDSQAADLQQSYPGSEMIITDSTGQVLAHYPNAAQNQRANLPAALSDALRAGQETLRGTGLDGVERLYGIARLPYGPEGNPAFVWIGLPASVAVASGNSILRLDLLVIGLVLLLGLALTQASANWLVIRWLHPLIAAIHKLEGGDLTARTGISGDKSELGSLVDAFDRMAAERERSTADLAETALRYRNLFDRVPAGLYRTTQEGLVLDANPAMVEMLGYPSLQKINATAFFVNAEDRLRWGKEIAERGELVNYEIQLQRADGEAIWVLDNTRVIRDSEGGILYYEGSLQDITQRKRAEQANLDANRQLHSVLNSITEAYLVLDCQYRFLEANPVALRDTFGGRPLSDLLGKVIWEEYPQAVDSEFYNQSQAALTQNHPVHFEALSKINDRWWEVHAYPNEDQLEIYLREITERKQMESHIRELAYHDPLTGLLNRRAFQEGMVRALSRVRRVGNQMAVLFLDLDGFKDINDRYGHAVGDAVLVEVARRLSRAVRLEDSVSRLGGDEFLLLAEIDNEKEAVAIATRVMVLLVEPFRADDLTITISTSIGISCFPQNGEDPETLVLRADQAMYIAKQEGKHRFHLSD
jgi:diguanylate cyclase (GGDEF)-like protein/PAS domain S-box-containing protein